MLSIVQVIVFPFWSIVEFHRFSTHMNIRVLSKAYQAIELLAFLCVIALLRTDRDPEQKRVLPRLFALPVRGHYRRRVLNLRKVSISSELKSFLLSMCIEAPESTTNMRSSVFLETSTGAFIFTGE